MELEPKQLQHSQFTCGHQVLMCALGEESPQSEIFADEALSVLSHSSKAHSLRFEPKLKYLPMIRKRF